MTVVKGAKLIPELLIKAQHQFNAILHDSVLLISGLKEREWGEGADTYFLSNSLFDSPILFKETFGRVKKKTLLPPSFNKALTKTSDSV